MADGTFLAQSMYTAPVGATVFSSSAASIGSGSQGLYGRRCAATYCIQTGSGVSATFNVVFEARPAKGGSGGQFVPIQFLNMANRLYSTTASVAGNYHLAEAIGLEIRPNVTSMTTGTVEIVSTTATN